MPALGAMTKDFASATVLILLLAYVVLAATPQGTGAPRCVNDTDRDRIRELTLEGIDRAFQDQVIHLFSVWLKDPEPEPVRASRGMELAISARQRARANALNWNPSKC